MSVSYDFLSFQDKNGVYKAVNEAYLKAFQLKREDIIGKSNRELLGEEHYNTYIRPKFTKALLGECSSYQTWMSFPGLGKRYVEVNYFPYRPDDEGNVEGVVVKVNDLTEHKKMEERLQQVEKMEAIGAVAGGVAHDLNNILSGIVSYPELLLMQLPENDRMREPLTTILQTGVKAAAIVEDLLTLSRRVVSIRQVVQLNEIVEEYLDSPACRNLLKQYQNVTIEKQLSKNLLPIKGSPTQVSKTVMNLVVNAVEAMTERGVISLMTENIYLEQSNELIEEGEYAALKVSDTGVGMTAEEQKRVFEPFYTKKVMGRSGTGLGMAVVWGVMKDHSGYIDLQSEPNKGTTITLLFPTTREQASPQVAEIDLSNYMGQGEQILVVDDIQEQRDISTAMLAQLGYNAHALESGEAAIDWLNDHKADLILLDMIMEPGMSGLSTYLIIRNMWPEKKVVIASGYSETSDLNSAMEAGVNGFIKKPYSLTVLGKTLRYVMDSKGVH